MNKKPIAILFTFSVISIGLFIFLTNTFRLRGEETSHNKLKKNLRSNTLTTKAENTNSHNKIHGRNDSTKYIATSGKIAPTDVPSIPQQKTFRRTKPIVLGFAGDVNFDENSKPVAKYDTQRGISGCISKGLLSQMQAADIMMLNNEFSYSLRGTKTPDKSYTFRANPKRVEILKEMGVDIVSLANNHALDYGQDALLDTFDTLEKADIDYVGAGRDLDRAKSPIYYTVGDKKIAYLAASKVIYDTNWYAQQNRPGMLGTYDPAQLIESIKEAKTNSDYIIVFVHWGMERKDMPENYQRDFAKKYIDAGADAVIGCHPHVMQGFEYYKGKPIAYSLGNYWFNSAPLKSGFLKLYLDKNETIRMQILPAMQENTYTYIIKENNKRNAYFNYMEGISFGVSIDKEGYVSIK